MLTRRKAIFLGAFAVIIIGFVLLKPPTPAISIAPEEIIDLGGYTVTNTILSAWVVIALMAIVTFRLYRRLRNVEEALVPRGFQNVIEALLEAFFTIVSMIAGEKNGRRFFPVVATIFIFLLAGNWFGLFPWNNAIGKVEDGRAEYLEALEDDAEDFFADLGVGLDEPALRELIADLNAAFQTVYLDPIPVEAGEQDEADARIAALRDGVLSGRELAVRAEFQSDPIPDTAAGPALAEAIEERLAAALAAFPFSSEQLDLIGADTAAGGLEKAAVLNLPLPSAAVDESELEGAVINSGGLNIIPLRAENFEYDPYVERVILVPNANGGVAAARLFDSSRQVGDDNQPATGAEITAPVTVNTAHLGIALKREEEGLNGGEGVGEIFPFFRSIATDLNLTLAIALWAFIFVQFWGVQTLGFGTNFGRFVGVGSAAVVKGPIGVFVGFLEIISEVARIVSFTFRLFGNIFAGEILLFMAAFLVPFLVATVFYGLEVFVGFIQAFVFAMLTLVFAVTAVSHGERETEPDEELESGA